MTADKAIDLLEGKAGVTRSRAIHLIGYSHVIRVFGWGATGLGRKGLTEAQRCFDVAGVDPVLIDFTTGQKLAAGAGMVVGGALAGGLAVAGAIGGNMIAEALLPDKPRSSRQDAEKAAEQAAGQDAEKMVGSFKL